MTTPGSPPLTLRPAGGAPTPDPAAQARAVRRTTWISIITYTVLALVFLYAASQTGWAWQLWVMTGLAIVLIGLQLVGLEMTRRGHWVGGVWLNLVAFMVAALSISTLFAGLGWALGSIVFLWTVLVVIQTLPVKQARGAILAGLLVGVVTVVLDEFGLAGRLTVPVLQSVFPVMAGLALGALGFLMVRQFANYSLRAKLILAFVGVAVLSVSAIAFATTRTTRAALTRQVGANLKTLAGSRAATIGALLDKEVGLMQSLALNKAALDEVEASNAAYPSDSTPATIQAQIKQTAVLWPVLTDADPVIRRVLDNPAALGLQEFRDNFPDNAEIFVTDKYGVTVAATNRIADYYHGNQDWWQAAYNNGQGATYISQPKFNRIIATFGIIVAVPVYSGQSKSVVGVLHTLYRIRAITEVLASGQFGQTGVADLWLPSSQILRPEGDIVEAEPELEAQLKAAAAADYVEALHEGMPTLVSQAPVTSPDLAIASLGWTLIVTQSPAEALQPMTSAGEAALVTSLGVLLLVGVLAFGAAQWLAAPIVGLTAVAEKVRAGDLTVQARVESRDEISTLAATFNSMTAQLRETLGSLEHRVADRTRALATSAEVSRRLSTILDQKQLVQEVVEEIQRAFNYYHVHIYLFDEGRENLVMVSGTGEAGQIMLAREHKIARGRGLVGRAAEANTAVVVPDVSKAVGWLPNPLLPETKAEIAVPIAVGGLVLGVLDVQHSVVGSLTSDDADLIQSIANQVAIALQNSRSYRQTQRQADLEVLINTIGQKIQSATSVEGALQVAAREVGRAVGARQTRVRLGHPARSPNGHD